MNETKNIIKTNNEQFIKNKENQNFKLYLKKVFVTIWFIYLILLILILSIGLKKYNNILYLTVKSTNIVDETITFDFYKTDKKPQADTYRIKTKGNDIYIYPEVRPLFWLYNRASSKMGFKDKRVKSITVNIKGINKIYLKDKDKELLIYEE